jgi:hypothetical protein
MPPNDEKFTSARVKQLNTNKGRFCIGCESILFLGHESPAEDSQVVHGIRVHVPYTISQCHQSAFYNIDYHFPLKTTMAQSSHRFQYGPAIFIFIC